VVLECCVSDAFVSNSLSKYIILLILESGSDAPLNGLSHRLFFISQSLERLVTLGGVPRLWEDA
jgi:hypothetical protein